VFIITVGTKFWAKNKHHAIYKIILRITVQTLEV